MRMTVRSRRATAGRLMALSVAALALAACSETLGSFNPQTSRVAEVDSESPSANAGNIASLTDVIQRNPNDSVAYNTRGIAYAKAGNYKSAIDDFTKALEIEPKAVSARYYRGIAYREKGQFDWAIEDFTKILEIDPKAAGTYYHRALTYYYKKEYDKSWKDMKKAQDLGYQIPSDFLEKLRKSLAR